MIYVTHDQVEAMTMADKIVVLQDGRIEQVGSPLELYRAPTNRFVAGFIGSPRMNFLEGPEAAKRDAHTIGVRPEHITPSPNEGTWKGRGGRLGASRLGHPFSTSTWRGPRIRSPCGPVARWTCTMATRST